jgi:coenzyme PQQ precursor peptide PqqA
MRVFGGVFGSRPRSPFHRSALCRVSLEATVPPANHIVTPSREGTLTCAGVRQISKGMIMKKTWTRPVVAEKQAGMEVTAYLPAEL